jgi:pyrroloquinoline quinone biosynthesis protein D
MSDYPPEARPVLPRGVRLQFEQAQDSLVLLYPEGMVKLNGSAGAILSRCDGVRSVGEIVADLERSYQTQGLGPDVQAFLTLAVEKHWLEVLP